MEELVKIIDQKIRPAINAHHGDIEVMGITGEGIVQIKLTGACSTCPGAQHTLHEVIESVLKEACSEVKGVMPVFQVNEELIQAALNLLRKGKPYDCQH